MVTGKWCSVLGIGEEEAIHIRSPRCFDSIPEEGKHNFHKNLCLKDYPLLARRWNIETTCN